MDFLAMPQETLMWLAYLSMAISAGVGAYLAYNCLLTNKAISQFTKKPELLQASETYIRELALDYRHSETDLLALVGQHPKSKSPLSQWTQAAIDEKNWTQVIRRAEIFRAEFPLDIFGFLTGGQGLSEAGRHEDAEKLLRVAQKRFCESPRPWLDYAMIAHRRRDWPTALRRWEAIRKKFPSESSAYVWAAVALWDNGRFADAEALLRQGMSNVDKTDQIMWALAETAHRQSDWAEARQRWSVFRSAYQARLEGYVRGSEASFRDGDVEEAIRLMEVALIISPNDNQVIRSAHNLNLATGRKFYAEERRGGAVSHRS